MRFSTIATIAIAAVLASASAASANHDAATEAVWGVYSCERVGRGPVGALFLSANGLYTENFSGQRNDDLASFSLEGDRIVWQEGTLTEWGRSQVVVKGSEQVVQLVWAGGASGVLIDCKKPL